MINKSYPYFVDLVTPNEAQIISDADLQAWVRLINAHSTELSVLRGLLEGAISWFEKETDYQIRKANYEWYTDDIPEFIPKRPYFGSLELAYLKEDNSYEVISTNDYRIMKTSKETVKTIFTGTKPTLQSVDDAVRVKFVAGWANTDIPKTIINALQVRVGEQFDNRGDGPDELNRLSDTLLAPFLPPQVA